MYGSAVFDVRSELKQSRHLLRKVVFSSLGILVFFFLFKQLIGIPFNYLNQISSSFLKLWCWKQQCLRFADLSDSTKSICSGRYGIRYWDLGSLHQIF